MVYHGGLSKTPGNYHGSTPFRVTRSKSAVAQRALQTIAGATAADLAVRAGKYAFSSTRKLLWPDKKTLPGRKRKNPSKFPQSVLAPNEMKEWSWTLRLGKGAVASKGTGHTYYDVCWWRYLDSSQGYQGVNDLMNLFTAKAFVTQVTAAMPHSSAVSGYKHCPEGLLSLDPEATAVSQRNTLETFASGELNLNRYVNVHSVTNRITYKNLCEYAIEVEVLWCLCKKTTKAGPGALWQQRDNTKQEDPLAYPTTAGVNPGSAVTSFPGQYPFSHKMWNQHYKVVKRDSLLLQAGSQVKINCKIFMNKRVSAEKIYKIFHKPNGENAYTIDSDPTDYIAGLTVVPLVIQKGSVQVYQTGEENNSRILGIASSKLGVYCEQKYHCTYGESSSNPQTRRIFPELWQNLEDSKLKIIDNQGVVQTADNLAFT